MKVLAIDIGAGTQDILVYDTKKGLEKSYKMVLPSPIVVLASEVRKSRDDLVVYGYTMGGGSFAASLINHLKRYNVYMTEKAARTIRDDLRTVKRYGVRIISEDDVPKMRGKKIRAGDVDLDFLMKHLSSFGIDIEFDAVAIAVMDHGVAPEGLRDRENRFKIYTRKLKENPRIESFAYLNEVPENLSRMRSVLESVRELYDGPLILMDTGPAAVLGALEDERVKGKQSVMSINVGNVHTVGMSLMDHEICGIFEHHTHLINGVKLKHLIKKLSEAKLEFREVFEDGGHGATTLKKISPQVISITGPNREKATGIGIFAAPAGDMMMTGTVGLVKATEYLMEHKGVWVLKFSQIA